MNKLQYSTEKYCFSPLVESWFQLPVNAGSLYKLHHLKKYGVFSRKKDQSSDWHKIFYKKIREDATFFNVYEKFLRDIIKPRYNNEEIVYQRIPTFRVHLAANLAVGEYHKDKQYRKKEWAEAVKEINYFLPFTDTNQSNTIWAESEEDKEDFSPMILKYGECMEWDGSNLTHGNKLNDSDQTRVSVDFRVIRRSLYVDSECASINTNTPFRIGGYYEVI
tara:strand:- start:1227 stop:1886 length:660 start_codon:yes stop_codon:yes gene_type:complete